MKKIGISLVCLSLVFGLAHLLLAKDKVYNVYCSYDMNSTYQEIVPLYLPYSETIVPDDNDVSIVANRKIHKILIQVVKKDSQQYVKIVFQKQLGLTNIKEIKINVKDKELLYFFDNVIFEGFNNVRYDIIKAQSQSTDDKEISFVYKNASTSKVKFLSFYCGNSLKDITMYDSSKHVWGPMKEKILVPGEEIRFKAKSGFFSSDIVYYLRPIVKFEFKGQTYTYLNLGVGSYTQ